MAVGDTGPLGVCTLLISAAAEGAEAKAPLMVFVPVKVRVYIISTAGNVLEALRGLVVAMRQIKDVFCSVAESGVLGFSMSDMTYESLPI